MKAAIYARVSTEKQEKQETIKSQIAALREFAEKKCFTVVGEYADDGYSGELLDRPELDKLRDDARKGLFDTVLIHSPDRLSRKYSHQCIIEEELRRSNIEITFFNRPRKGDTPEDALLLGVQGLIAEYEKEKILERMRRGKLHKAKSGCVVGTRPPYGYRLIPGTRTEPTHFELVKAEAKVVRLIFDLLVVKGLSIRKIAGELTKRGIRAPRGGRRWQTSTVGRILRNETYTGVTYYNKHVAVEPRDNGNGRRYRRNRNTSQRLRPKDQWISIKLPPELIIIPKDLHCRAQKQLALNSQRSPRNAKRQYLLQSLLKCGLCGCPFSGIPVHDERYYRCTNVLRRYPDPRDCDAPRMKAPKLESAVWETIAEAIKNPQIIKMHADRLRARSSERTKGHKEALSNLEGRLQQIANEENRILDAYRQEVISLDQLRDQLAEVQKKKVQTEHDREALLAEVEGADRANPEWKDIEKTCRQIAKRLRAIEDDFEVKRRILRLIVTKIILERRKVRIKCAIPIDHFQAEASPCHIAFPSSVC